jgi:hypothetical protein
MITQAIEYLSESVSVSSISIRGTRLLNDLLAEEQNLNSQNNNGGHTSQSAAERGQDRPAHSKPGERSLNVAAFVKKFCETDQPQAGGSPIATTHMPLWLQQENTSHSFPHRANTSGDYNGRESSSHFHPSGSYQPYESMLDYQIPATARLHHESFATAFGQHVGETFDVRSLNWMDDLLGLAPSHSI